MKTITIEIPESAEELLAERERLIARANEVTALARNIEAALSDMFLLKMPMEQIVKFNAGDFHFFTFRCKGKVTIYFPEHKKSFHELKLLHRLEVAETLSKIAAVIKTPQFAFESFAAFSRHADKFS